MNNVLIVTSSLNMGVMNKIFERIVVISQVTFKIDNNMMERSTGTGIVRVIHSNDDNSMKVSRDFDVHYDFDVESQQLASTRLTNEDIMGIVGYINEGYKKNLIVCKVYKNEENKTGIMSYTATWCEPCNRIKPLFEDLMRERKMVETANFFMLKEEYKKECNPTVPYFVIYINDKTKGVSSSNIDELKKAIGEMET